MDRSQIETYFVRLSELLAASEVVGEIVLFGGAAMVWAHKARLSTKDVDAVFAPKAVLSIVERYYPRNQIQPKTRFAIEELCQQLEEP